MKKKKRIDEATKKKKRRIYEDESSDYEESSSHDFVDIDEGIHDLLVTALEDENWSVQDVITMLCNEMKFVVSEYE
jgi:hypothetical protein